MSNVLSKIHGFFSPSLPPVGKLLNDTYSPLFPNALKGTRNIEAIGHTISDARWAIFHVQNKPSDKERKADFVTLRRNLKIATSIQSKALSKRSTSSNSLKHPNTLPLHHQLRLRLNFADTMKAHHAEKQVGDILHKYNDLIAEHECNATQRFGPRVDSSEKWTMLLVGVEAVHHAREKHVVSPPASTTQAEA